MEAPGSGPPHWSPIEGYWLSNEGQSIWDLALIAKEVWSSLNTMASLESPDSTKELPSGSDIKKFPELEPFHQDGKLPPSEERKEIVRKIRARTLSRESQALHAGLASSGLGLIIQLSMASSSSQPSAPAQALLLIPGENTNRKENPSIIQGTGKCKKAVSSDSEDTAWMHSDDDTEQKPFKKPKKKKMKKKVTSASTILPDEMSTVKDEVETKLVRAKPLANSAGIQGLVPAAGLERDDATQGEWSTVSKLKIKKKDEVNVKTVSRITEAKGKDRQKKTDPTKTNTKAAPKPIETTVAEPKKEFRFQREEFPDLGSQTTMRKKPVLVVAPTAPTPEFHSSTQVFCDANILVKGPSQKILKVQVKSAHDKNGSQSPRASPKTISKTEAPQPVEHMSLKTEDMKAKISSANPSPKMELSALTSGERGQQATSKVVELSNTETGDLDSQNLPAASQIDSTPTVDLPPLIWNGKDHDSDYESLLSEATVIPESDDPSPSSSEPVKGEHAAKGSPLTADDLAGKARGTEEHCDVENNTSEIPPLQGSRASVSAKTDDTTAKARYKMATTSEVPHPLVESTKNIGTWVSDPGKITINGIDALELLGDQYPPGLTVHDHPDVNIFMHSDWIACTYCEVFIRETSGGAGQPIPGHGALICSRCGPCSLTRYCSRACLLNDFDKHWERCGGVSCGVFPLNWSDLPKHCYQQLPALDTWSHSYNYHHTKERARQMTYIANLHDAAIPHFRKAYFDRVLKGTTGPEAPHARYHITTSHGTWNQPQALGDYFLFVDHQLMDQLAKNEKDSSGHIPTQYVTLSRQLFTHKNTEGLCPATALALQLPRHQRVAFNRLINACFVTNNTVLVEYLWHWIRVEISTNEGIRQWCAVHGLPTAALFMLWALQFEKEFGLTQERQVAMLDEARPTSYHPFSSGWPKPWLLPGSESSMNSLVYEHELYHPVLRAWRCHDPNEPLIPRNPWARFRGDGYVPLKRSSGEVVPVRVPILPWNNGWQGMPPFLWKKWLNTKHAINICEALEASVSEQESLISDAESRKKSVETPMDKEELKDVERKLVIHQSGREMATLTELRSSLKSLSREHCHTQQINAVNPYSVDGMVESDDGGQKLVNVTKVAATNKTPTEVTMEHVREHGKPSSKHSLNPAVPEFISMSPEKTFVELPAPMSIETPEEEVVTVSATDATMAATSPAKVGAKASHANGATPTKALATSADADKWLGAGGFSIPQSWSTATESSSPCATTDNTSAAIAATDNDDIYARWKAAEEAYCALVKEEMEVDQARKKRIMQLRVQLALAEREDQEAAQAGIAKVAAQQKNIEALRTEMKTKGSEEPKEKVMGKEERDGMEATEVFEV